jgi:hypothetical protein
LGDLSSAPQDILPLLPLYFENTFFYGILFKKWPYNIFSLKKMPFSVDFKNYIVAPRPNFHELTSLLSCEIDVV